MARLSAVGQRYTSGRRALVAALAAAGRPVTVPEMLETTTSGGLHRSSAYRNLTVLADAGVVHRVVGAGEFARFELAEGVAGHHHHHLLCDGCGSVSDVAATPGLERALEEAALAAAGERGFEVRAHRIDLVGRCRDCR